MRHLTILTLALAVSACAPAPMDGPPDPGAPQDTDPGVPSGGDPADSDAPPVDTAFPDDGILPPATRVANPFEGADGYINPDYVANVTASMAEAPELGDALAVVAQQPTAVWLDRIAAIEGGPGVLGLQAHLDAAQAQQRASGDPTRPVVVTLVVYDLPNRDCAAFASNGELRLEADGMRRYKQEYIDVIAEVLSQPRYRSLRVVTVIEPDSLPNLITNIDSHPTCAEAADAYQEGVAYAISTLGALENVYVYLDIAHSGWLGWEHGDPAARLYRDVMDLAGGAHLVTGFATNVSNYSTLQEQLDPYADMNAHRRLIEDFYEWNRVIDEHTFVDRLREHFPGKGFLIDTGRNGWHPRAHAPMDRRTHRGNWCNVSGAGIGERPQASPRHGVHAYVWIKPPGESDGTSDSRATSPNDEGKRYDHMCGPDAVERENGQRVPTDALRGAPHAGHWFHEQLLMLVRNAWPPL